MTSFLFRTLPWILLLLIFAATVGPIEFRPLSPLPTQAERFSAFAVVGLLFTIFYPKYFWQISVLVIASSVGFELLQMLSASRHGRLSDLAFKLAGALCGLTIGKGLSLAYVSRMVSTSPR